MKIEAAAPFALHCIIQYSRSSLKWVRSATPIVFREADHGASSAEKVEVKHMRLSTRIKGGRCYHSAPDCEGIGG